MDKKILKEFLRLKWEETKVLFILISLLIIVILGLCWLDVNKELLISKIIIWSLAVLWLSLVSYIIFTGIKELIEWLKSNWKQATKNVYPNKRRKK